MYISARIGFLQCGPTQRVHKGNLVFLLFSAAPADFIGFFIFAEINSLSVSTLFQFTHSQPKKVSVYTNAIWISTYYARVHSGLVWWDQKIVVWSNAFCCIYQIWHLQAMWNSILTFHLVLTVTAFVGDCQGVDVQFLVWPGCLLTGLIKKLP